MKCIFAEVTVVSALLLLASSCSTDNVAALPSFKGEYINREKGESRIDLSKPQKTVADKYPWERITPSLPLLTKEHFRCKGCYINPSKMVVKWGQEELCRDCDGIDGHSLPIKDDREFIYPVLIQMLNDVQQHLGAHVCITSGHRCLDHHTYATDGFGKVNSKHMIGAAVTFYVQNFENTPEVVVDALQACYQKKSPAAFESTDVAFQRWDLDKTDVSTPPWYNKELFIKIYRSHEGRDGDNNHSYPFISLQVRYDRDRKDKVLTPDEKGINVYWRKG